MSKGLQKHRDKKEKCVNRRAKELVKQPASQVKLLVGLVVAVCVVVAVAHWPALSARAFSFDDDQYLTENILVQNPGWTSARRFLTEVLEPSTVRGYYQPLAMISLMVDYALGGREEDLMPFHRTSLLLHMANTALIIVLLYLLFGQVWPAAAAGLLFGVHPMTVEPIPWVGERKTLLAAFFALWCLVLYVHYAKKNDWKFLFGCFVMYGLALMSKPTSTPLPALMLLMDYWPLRRLNKKAILEKIPFFALGGIFAVITYISQSRTAIAVTPGQYGLQRIPLILCHNIIFYLYKIIWPVNLSSHYAFPAHFVFSNPVVLVGVIGTCILIPLLVISLRWTRSAFTGWLFFFVAIFPTIGIIGFTNVIASDKFAYLPAFGLLMLLVSLLVWFLGVNSTGKRIKRRIAVIIIILAFAGTETVATRRYLTRWKDTVTFCEYMLTLTPDSPFVYNQLGYALQSQNKLDRAIDCYHKAIRLDPSFSTAYYNLGTVFQLQNKPDQAVTQYRNVLKLEPDSAGAHNNLAVVLAEQGKLDQAIEHYHHSLKLEPEVAEVHDNLGRALLAQGKSDQAIRCFNQALDLNPDDPVIHNNLALALAAQGKSDQAAYHYRQVLRIKPNDPEAYNNLGGAFAVQGKLDQAISHFQQALQLEPDYIRARINLASALAAADRFDDAVIHYRQALQLIPDSAQMHNDLAQALAMSDKPDEALQHFQKALRLEPDLVSSLLGAARLLVVHPEPNQHNTAQAIALAERAAEVTKHEDPIVLETLAAAYAAAGRLDLAVTTAEEALSLASGTQADYIRKQLELYKKSKP